MTPDQTPKDVTSYSWITYAWVLVLAIWGGAVNYWRKVKMGQARPFNFPELIGELVTSAFVGVLTFWLCQAAGINDLASAALVGIAGHMGGRTMFVMERWVSNRVFGLPPMDNSLFRDDVKRTADDDNIKR